MKKALGVVAGLALTVSGLGAAYAQHEHHHEAKAASAASGQATLKGEVLDMACYMAHDAKGSQHQKCGKACLLGGGAAGLMTADGLVYLLVEDHEAGQAYKQALELAGEQAELSGKLVKKGGLSALIVSKAAKSK